MIARITTPETRIVATVDLTLNEIKQIADALDAMDGSTRLWHSFYKLSSDLQQQVKGGMVVDSARST